MTAKRIKFKYLFGALIFMPLLFWYVAVPVVDIYYSKDGKKEIRYIWNTQHSIHKEGMNPGQSTFETGHIFPNEEFFMIFEWGAREDHVRCISITPKWTRTKIYLDSNGAIDTHKTAPGDLSRIKKC
ncbi:hypothetical protein ACQR3P_15180 [Rhodococcus sp. IEGM1300]